jgi:23S rRNA (pseudouridine1915-N3)-methyltransferase
LRKISLIWIGRTRESFIREGVEKYLRLIKRFVNIEIIELKEERNQGTERAKKKEAERILKAAQSYILLAENGRLMNSLEFSSYIFSLQNPVLVIGGPFGVSGEVEDRAEDVVSLSPLTLTHEMARLVLLEQLYRAITIKKGMRYHH